MTLVNPGLDRWYAELRLEQGNASYDVVDVFTGDRYTRGERNYVRLDPVVGEPAHICRVEKDSD